MALTNEIIQQKLTDKFGEQVTYWEQPYGMLTFVAEKDINIKVLQFLFDEIGRASCRERVLMPV